MPDLKAAAEKTLKAIAGVHVGMVVQPGIIVPSSDVIAVCEAYLAEHDETPIDNDFRRIVGFVDDCLPIRGACNMETGVEYPGGNVYTIWQCESPGGPRTDDIWLKLTTRGQLVRLLSVLNPPLSNP